ncbi:MAG: hypothetical protein RXR31_01355 [Thermoproteota archaeon]
MIQFELEKNVKTGEYKLDDIFKGLENSWIAKNVLKNEFEEIRKNLRIRVVNCNGYMWTDDTDGSIYVCKEYLKKGNKLYIYLDILHEIIHHVQWKRGLDLFDRKYSYVDRPTEVEAYKYTVEEARNLGMKKEEILDYLKVEWISEEDLIRLAKKLNVI